jgi:DNA-binding transcriptional LysR family regulator
VDVRVSANNGLVDLRRDGIDLAIRYTAPSLAPAGAIRLFGESVAPVAHPSLGIKALRSERTIAQHALLEFDDARHQWLQWRDWLAAHGLQQAKSQGVLHFNQYDQVIQAALAGHGIALGRLELIQPLLETQQLIQLAPALQSSDTTYAYWLIHADDEARDEVRQVAAWIEAEARAAGA